MVVISTRWRAMVASVFVVSVRTGRGLVVPRYFTGFLPDLRVPVVADSVDQGSASR
jgi:hypothetical protein